MKLAVISWTVLLVSVTSGSPALSRVKRVGEYTDKLERLRAMLGSIGEKNDRDTDVKLIKSKVREPMRSQESGDTANRRQDKIKMFASRLADGDRDALKMLEHVLSSVPTQGEGQPPSGDSTGEFLGTSYNEDTGSSGSRDRSKAEQEVEKNIMALLQKFRQRLGPETRSSSQVGGVSQPDQTIGEGQFGDFKTDVLHAVESRLVDDLKMALHSGFSVKDIISDLETSDGVWQDSNTREIERELNTLKRLHSNQ